VGAKAISDNLDPVSEDYLAMSSDTVTSESHGNWPPNEWSSSPLVLVLAHGEQAPSAHLLDGLIDVGLTPEVRQVRCAGDLPRPASVDAGILVGSQSAAEAEASAHYEAECDWVRRVDEAGGRLLGVGYGARLLAVALGGRLSLAEHPLRGWAMVDTALPHLIPPGPWMSWQRDVIAIPPRAQLLAHNRLGPQVFQAGRHLGVQFHLDATPHTASEWADRAEGPFNAYALLNTATRDLMAARSCTRRLLATFLAGVLA
jgi:GMP synthase (glutamine-hydrolysing)